MTCKATVPWSSDPGCWGCPSWRRSVTPGFPRPPERASWCWRLSAASIAATPDFSGRFRPETRSIRWRRFRSGGRGCSGSRWAGCPGSRNAGVEESMHWNSKKVLVNLAAWSENWPQFLPNSRTQVRILSSLSDRSERQASSNDGTPLPTKF